MERQRRRTIFIFAFSLSLNNSVVMFSCTVFCECFCSRNGADSAGASSKQAWWSDGRVRQQQQPPSPGSSREEEGIRVLDEGGTDRLT